ncbi:hypothetical protein ACWOA6_09110 [Globicatella sulfidifaciens]|uniref:Uncharacterized protein n=2 Tax=Globicatella sulfidifaciens TaxID=136093 RepID=A0A1T4NNV3_9LACT|nr:hypothetical protein [Globicatella sulfidifaciens]NLJ18106.1 hypothetical protein [Globicatella sulfidifaciens]SJZ80862.1 hypothetical protein SAMN02746011_01809 [Globicatella sulfidifaciens DSM 15739]
MTQTVYTNYWVNRRDKLKKEHGSYPTEEQAIKGIETWWEIHKEKYKDVKHVRTNTGALEIYYGDDNYYYRIEQRQISGSLPSLKYKLKTDGEINSLRKQNNLRDDLYLFDELAEPYRDRLIVTMADAQKVRDFVYTEKGAPIIKLSEIKQMPR